MGLINCIYTSAATNPDLSEESLRTLFAQCSVNNVRRQITGVLIFDAGAFFQVLEGERAEVESLYDRIEADSRHSLVRKLISEPIAERAFPGWTLAYRNDVTHRFKRITEFEEYHTSALSLGLFESGRACSLFSGFCQGKWRVPHDAITAPPARTERRRRGSLYPK